MVIEHGQIEYGYKHFFNKLGKYQMKTLRLRQHVDGADGNIRSV